MAHQSRSLLFTIYRMTIYDFISQQEIVTNKYIDKKVHY